MGQTTSIQWTDATWNPIRGCSRVSEGCRFCYAERQAARFSGPGKPFEGFVHIVNGHPTWTAKVQLVPKHLHDPLRWKASQMIFVNSMSDLWHEDLPLDSQISVYAVMAAASWHTFQVLTKRPEVRFRAFSEPALISEVEKRAIDIIANWDGKAGWVGWKFRWPLPNVWEGVSVETSRYLSRIESLRQTPAAVRFISFEPLLEDLGTINLKGIDLAIWGGESGPEARPCEIEWIRDGISRHTEFGCRQFVKQLGARPRCNWYTRQTWPGGTRFGMNDDPRLADVYLHDPKGGEPSEWPDDLRVREMPEVRK